MSMLYPGVLLLILACLMFLLRYLGAVEWFNPSRMDYLNLILALGGIALSMPSSIQMACGKPRITLGFGKKDNDQMTVLFGEIFNYPLSNKFLKALGVRTDQAEDVWASFRILEHGTRRQVFHDNTLPKIHTYTGTESQRAVIPASAIPGVFRIVEINKEQKKVFAGESEFELTPGLYIVTMEVSVGTDEYTKEKKLEVLEKYPYAAWG